MVKKENAYLSSSLSILLVLAIIFLCSTTGSAQPSDKRSSSGSNIPWVIIASGEALIQSNASPNAAPEAYFTVSPSSGQYPLTVNFDASGSTDADGTITSYSWSFGDGGTGNGEKASYTYRDYGSFSPTLKVTDNLGLSSSLTSKIVVTSGRSIYVTITSEPASVGTGKPSVIRINAADKDSKPISGARVTFNPVAGGKIEPISGTTDPSGQFTSTFTGSEGNYKISTSVKKEGLSAGSGEILIKVLKERPLSVAVTSDSKSIEPGESSKIKVIVTASDGTPVQGASVMLTSIPNGTIRVTSGQTNSRGEFISAFTGSTEGEVTIKALVKKRGFADGSGEVLVVVSSGNYLVLVAIILIALAAIGSDFWINGRLQIMPLQSCVPCDGKSTLPIKVQFIDFSGKLKKQKKDRVVKINATSGMIQNMVVPAGKESAEAMLTLSKEYGPVKITARSGIQRAAALVNFMALGEYLHLEISPISIPADGISISSIVIRIKDGAGNFITSPSERVINLETTLGTITSPVTIPPRVLTGIAILTAGRKSGTAVVTASNGTLKAEGKIIFEELAERYCMHCGTSMKREVQVCPACGDTPPMANDIKQCSTCSSVLPVSAKFCDRCGSRQPA